VDRFDRHYSRNILLRMGVAGLLAAAAVAWQWSFLARLYLEQRLPLVGEVVNGGILLLFLAGTGHIVRRLSAYRREEAAVADFLAALRRGDEDPAEGLDPESLMALRYRTLAEAARRGRPVDHNALAATLVAHMSTEASFPRFVHNVLILTGVFGTLVSLSIALLGAADLLAATDGAGLGTVIQGMSTALSTTLTAIGCYFFFGYFHLKFTDAQTRLLAAIEDITATRLVPYLTPGGEQAVGRFVGLLQGAEKLLEALRASQEQFGGLAEGLDQRLEAFRADLDGLGRQVAAIRKLLHEGFRLPEEP